MTKTRQTAVFLVLGLPPSALVLGFCSGGLLTKGYGGLFGGAAIGALLGLALAIFGTVRWPDSVRWRVLGAFVVGAAVVAGGTWLKVNWGGHW
jgi:hypothetical protein